MLQPDDEQRPFWLQSILTAKAIALDHLSPEDRAAAQAAQREARERAKAKRLAGRERMKQIIAMTSAGHTCAEVAANLDRTAEHIRKFAASRGVLLSRTLARYAVQMTVDQRAVLRGLAKSHGTMDDCQVLETIVHVALAGDGSIAKFLLRNPDGSRDALKRAFTMGWPT